MAKKTKNLGSSLLIILLILIILASSGIGIWAWARYQSSIQGQAVAQVARWNFNLVDADSQTTDVIELAVTRTDNNQTVAEGKVAPGTYGKFEVGIDARGTETILSYVIDVALTNKPTNMKFYFDENKSEEIVVDNSRLIKDGFMTLEDVKEIRTETIYWDWPYETGSTAEEIMTNDIIDTEDESKLIAMQITVTGVEVLGKTIAQTSMQVTQPSNGTNYQVGETITIKAKFSGDVYGGVNKEEITAQTAPVMSIKFDGTSVAKVATVNSVNGVVLAEENKKIVQFDSVKGHVIKYKYTIEADDIGEISVDSYTGKVYSEDGISLDVRAMKLLIEKFKNLADVVQPGDYVNYDASSNGVKTFTSNDCLAGTGISATISTDIAFDSEAKSQWRVLSVDKGNGIVELMAVEPTVQTVSLSGGNGFINSEKILNNIGEIYGQGKGANAGSGRSITREDIEKYSSYIPSIGSTKTYTSGNFYKEIKDENGNITGYDTITTEANSTNSITMTQNYYGYTTASGYFENTTVFNMIFRKATDSSKNKLTFWLAKRCVVNNSSFCQYIVPYVYNGNSLGKSQLYESDGSTISRAYSVVPIVSLESNIQTLGQNENGVWELVID